MNISKDYVKIERVHTSLRMLALAGAASLWMSGCASETVKESPASGAAAAARRSYDGPLPALPPPVYQLPRPVEVVEAVYNFAGRRPDVLQYVPCFCGCQASGHVGNDDCFVASRDTTGKPSWDLHGMG